MHVKLRDVMKSSKTPKEKWGHIWEYYKLHMAVILMILASLSYISYSLMHRKTTVLDVAFYSSVTVSFAEQEELNQRLSEELLPTEEGNKQIVVQAYNQEDTTEQQKFVTMLAAKEIDLFIMARQQFDELNKDGYFLPLEEYVDMVQTDFCLSDGQATGIPLRYFPDLEKLVETEGEWIVAVPVNMTQTEEVAKVFSIYYHSR